MNHDIKNCVSNCTKTSTMKTYLSILLIFCLTTAYGQNDEEEYRPSGFLVNINYGVETPFGILADRFGTGMSLGLNPVYMTSDRWLFGVDAKLMFGGIVKEDVLENLLTSNGQIIAQDKTLTTANLNQRGYFFGASVGKLIPLGQSGSSSLRITGSLGFLQHKIRIDDGGNLPQLSGAYSLGYDRLTYGLGVTEFVGYQYLSKSKLINFYAGMEFTQGFTKNRRTINYDTNISETAPRQDLLWNFKIGWILPLYNVNDSGYY